MTVKDLKNRLEDLPDDLEISIGCNSDIGYIVYVHDDDHTVIIGGKD